MGELCCSNCSSLWRLHCITFPYLDHYNLTVLQKGPLSESKIHSKELKFLSHISPKLTMLRTEHPFATGLLGDSTLTEGKVYL